MASTKQKQLQAKLQRKLAKLADKVKVVSPNRIKLYKTDEVLNAINSPFMTTITPEGIMPYKSAIVNLAFIPKGKMAPTECWMTGYGISYMTKVMSGTPRGDERMLNAFLDGDENGDMLQISYTVVGDFSEDDILSTAIVSLGDDIKKNWNRRYIKTETGKSPTPLGWVRV